MSLNDKQKGILKRLRDKERRFKRMPKFRKRVMIAKDVLEQINSKAINPQSKVWVQIDSWIGDRPSVGSDLRSELVKAGRCNACALGAVFVCSVFRDPSIKIASYGAFESTSLAATHDEIKNQLKKYFTDTQLNRIELAFERGSGWAINVTNKDNDAVRFGEQFPSDKMRIEAIMLNIINNNGSFEPPKLTT